MMRLGVSGFLVRCIFLGAVVLAPVGSVAEVSALEALQRQQRSIFSKVAPAVVFITHEEGLGSGFFVSSDGVILTNHHVVEDRESVTVVLHDGRRLTGRVIERERYWDLALVKVEIDDAPVLKMAGMEEVAVGDWAASVGHGEGGIWTYTTGMISNVYPHGEERPVFQTQIPLNPGSSGGPVVNIKGEAIGIVTAGIIQAQSINFAIPIEQAISYLPGLSSRCDCLVIELEEKAPVYVDGVLVGTGPRLVLMAERRSYEIVVVLEGRPRRQVVQWPETRTVRFSGE